MSFLSCVRFRFEVISIPTWFYFIFWVSSWMQRLSAVLLKIFYDWRKWYFWSELSEHVCKLHLYCVQKKKKQTSNMTLKTFGDDQCPFIPFEIRIILLLTFTDDPSFWLPCSVPLSLCCHVAETQLYNVWAPFTALCADYILPSLCIKFSPKWINVNRKCSKCACFISSSITLSAFHSWP